MKPEASAIPERDRTPEKRKPLTRAEFGQLMIDQEGKCACPCGEKLQPLTEGVIDEDVAKAAEHFRKGLVVLLDQDSHLINILLKFQRVHFIWGQVMSKWIYLW